MTLERRRLSHETTNQRPREFEVLAYEGKSCPTSNEIMTSMKPLEKEATATKDPSFDKNAESPRSFGLRGYSACLGQQGLDA